MKHKSYKINKPNTLGTKQYPILYKSGCSVIINHWYRVGGIVMKSIHGDPLGILTIGELFSKNDLSKRIKF